MNKEVLKKAAFEFQVNATALLDVRKNFTKEIEEGLLDASKSSLKLLPSYLSIPTGDEGGTYLALDFGGTNVRILKVKIWKHGNHKILKKIEYPLKAEGKYDFIGKNATGEGLFEFIAKLIAVTLEGKTEEIYLGHTFSFPSEQIDLGNAKLISWTKEFQTQGVEGKNVTELLEKALAKFNLTFVKPVAVINDTVATLLAGAYSHANTLIGSIYATGHNTCYLEPDYNGQPMIINLESGGFNKLDEEQNSYDKLLDKGSEKPGEQLLEKMVSGRYIGELFSLVMKEALKSEESFGFTSEDLCSIAQNIDVAKIVTEKTGAELEEGDDALIVNLANNIVTRSASLISATYLGIYYHIKKLPTIAMDGSLYTKNRFLQDIMGESLKKAGGNIRAYSVTDASALGAAIAAAIAVGK